MTGCKVSSFPQKLSMTLQTHIESTSTSEWIKITSLAHNLKHSMWSLLASVPNANTLEQHVQVVGGRGRERSNSMCSVWSNLWYKTNNYQRSGEWKTNVLSITQFQMPMRCPQDPQSSVIFLTYLVTCQALIPALKWSCWDFPFVSSKQFSFQKRLRERPARLLLK